MAARAPTEEAIDRLYQLPLDEFTAARNRLAKEAGAADASRIRALAKPSVSAWAVNQLYWRDRKTYDALVEAAERVRAAHRAVLAGKAADRRSADAEHRDALKAAIASTLSILENAGHNASTAIYTEITRTLETLPVEGPPGRLTGPLRPEGFAALRGLPIQPRPAAPARKATRPDKEAEDRERAREQERARKEAERERAEARARERRERAEVAALRKRLAAAERASAAAKREWERARDEELDLRNALRRAEEALGRTRRAIG